MTTATKTRSKTTEPDQAARHEAVEDFMAKLEHRAEDYPWDYAAAVIELTAALGDQVDHNALDQALAAVAAIEKRVAGLYHNPNPRAVAQGIPPGPAVGMLFAPQVASVRRHLELAIGGPREVSEAEKAALAEVEKAKAEITAAEDALAAARASLGVAVESGDVAEVLRLRGEVEVTCPGRIDEANLHLIDARIRLLALQAVPLTEAATDAAAPLQEAEDRLEQAQRALEDAQTHHARAERAASQADDDLDRHAAETNRLRADRDRMAVEHQAKRRDRTRRLAGLDTLAPSVAEPAPIPTRSLIVPSPISVRS